ncbi:MAG: glycosyltransferase [Acidimicrobiales bacterium]|nr:glycosyltransferase [Acidimicrobiales bacterium]
MNTPAVTVAVCTHNRAGKLERCLAALALQKTSSSLTVLVIDDGSTDDTRAVAEAAGVTYLRQEPQQGLGAARVRALAATESPLLILTDDDCLPDPDWVERLVVAMEDPAVVAAGGAVTPAETDHVLLRYYAVTNPVSALPPSLLVGGGALYRLRLQLENHVRLPRPLRPGPLYAAVGANMILRVDALRAVGGFDAAMTFGGEDEDVCVRLRERFGDDSIVYVEDAHVGHDYDPSLRDALRRKRAYGAGAGRNFVNNRSGLPPLFPGPIAVAAVAGTALLARRHRPSLLLAALSAPLAVYPRWSMRALRERDPESLAYAYIQFGEEAATTGGFFAGVLRTVRGKR